MRILSFLFVILLSAPVFAFELKTEARKPIPEGAERFDLSFRDGAQWSALIQSAEFDTVFSEREKNHFSNVTNRDLYGGTFDIDQDGVLEVFIRINNRYFCRGSLCAALIYKFNNTNNTWENVYNGASSNEVYSLDNGALYFDKKVFTYRDGKVVELLSQKAKPLAFKSHFEMENPDYNRLVSTVFKRDFPARSELLADLTGNADNWLSVSYAFEDLNGDNTYELLVFLAHDKIASRLPGVKSGEQALLVYTNVNTPPNSIVSIPNGAEIFALERSEKKELKALVAETNDVRRVYRFNFNTGRYQVE